MSSNPTKIAIVALAPTISFCCKKSFVCAIVSEYIGRLIPAYIARRRKNIIREIYDDATITKESPDAIKVTPN